MLTTVVVLLASAVALTVLGRLSISSYRSYAVGISRMDAQRELQELARRLTRCLARGEAPIPDLAPQSCVTFPQTTPEDTYLITGSIEGSDFLLTATPLAAQAEDTECGALTLDQAGSKGITGVGTREACWAEPAD